jgi:hypothetical protein
VFTFMLICWTHVSRLVKLKMCPREVQKNDN